MLPPSLDAVQLNQSVTRPSIAMLNHGEKSRHSHFRHKTNGRQYFSGSRRFLLASIRDQAA
jgi:hypothetical protein